MDADKKTIIDRLNEELTAASKKYYMSQESIMSDTDFDLKLNELRKMQTESGYTPKDSITLRIGSDLQKEFKKIQHPEPMLTIDNSYDASELQKWIENMLKKYHPKKAEISTKFDGVSLEIHYKDGKMVSASTRGDKVVGDDVTENAKTIMSIPLEIKDSMGVSDVYVRGEVLMPRSVLKKLNAASVKKFANCRNAASGSLKQLDPKITAKRGLIFRPWDVLFFSDEKLIADIDKAAWLDLNGFEMEDFAKMRTEDFGIGLVLKVDAFKQHLDASKPDWDYDGVVVKIYSNELRESIGSSDHRAIEWGIARKWNEDRTGITILNSVTWQVGSTGILTPVGNLEPIGLDGVTVSNVTLHNMDFIRKNNLQINAPVKITRSGGVIPYVQGRPTNAEFFEVNPDAYLAEPVDIEVPKNCPICKAPVKDDKCTNTMCPGIMLGKIENWCSKDIMNIEGVGPEIIRDLINVGLVTWPMDLYSLATQMRPDELLERLGPGYGLTTANNIINSILASISKPIELVIAGMGIDGIRTQNAKALIQKAGSLERLIEMSEAELMVIDGIGEVLASNIRNFMKSEGKAWLTALTEYGFKTQANAPAALAGNELSGMKIVFSGSSKWFKGDDCEKFLESRGAKCGHSVSSKTNYLVTGVKPGQSKVDKAAALGVKTLSEDEFFAQYKLPTSW